MEKLQRVVRAVFLAFLSSGLTVLARADGEARPRVTITGTGSDISIHRTESPAPAKTPELSRKGAPSSVLSEAIHMKEAKASDELVVSYLRENASRLPIVVDLETVRRLQTAGAGKAVIRYLASVSAIEIGESGAVGGGPAVEYPIASEPDFEPGDASPYGYPIVGGYSAPSGRSGFHSFRRPGVVRFQRAPAFVRPVFPMPAQFPAAPRLRHFVFGVR